MTKVFSTVGISNVQPGFVSSINIGPGYTYDSETKKEILDSLAISVTSIDTVGDIHSSIHLTHFSVTKKGLDNIIHCLEQIRDSYGYEYLSEQE